MKNFLYKLLCPGEVRRDELNKIWNARPKTKRILVEFEDGTTSELSGGWAANYARDLFFVMNGFGGAKELSRYEWEIKKPQS